MTDAPTAPDAPDPPAAKPDMAAVGELQIRVLELRRIYRATDAWLVTSLITQDPERAAGLLAGLEAALAARIATPVAEERKAADADS